VLVETVFLRVCRLNGTVSYVESQMGLVDGDLLDEVIEGDVHVVRHVNGNFQYYDPDEADWVDVDKE
jgi:hypothetical protein